MKIIKKMSRIVLKIFLVIICLVGIVYALVFVGHKVIFQPPFTAEPTIKPLEKDGFILDAASHEQPQTMEEYISILAQQTKAYNDHIDSYWPNNKEKNQYILAKSLDEDGAYLIAPNGDIKKMTASEFKEYNVSSINTEGQWAPFEKNGISGAYMAIHPKGLKNYYTFQKYYHLGTYDQFLSYSHELFHSLNQKEWSTEDNYPNMDRNDYLEDTESRRIRMLLQQQLALAISDENNREQHTQDAVATYLYYQEKKGNDDPSLLYDRLEGTAFYYELISALYAGYPDQINNQNDAYKALEVILADDNPAYRSTGATAEGYTVGGFAGILLDLKALDKNEDPNKWKETIEKNAWTTPMTLLADAYKDQSLPAVKSIPTEKKYEEWIAEVEKVAPSGSTPQK
ncbi:hypothetical protein, partial [Enterococcus sp. AZ150]